MTQPSPFDQLGYHPEDKEYRDALVSFTCRKFGWSQSRAIDHLKSLDERGLAYVGVDLRADQRKQPLHRVEYNPFQQDFMVK